MKKIFFIFLLSIFCFVSFADHLKGGWIYYAYLGNGSSPNTSKYKITVKQYLRCGALSSGQLDKEVFLGIFDGANNQLIQTETIPISGTESENKTDFNCIINPPSVCYRIDEYSEIIDLPDNTAGYILSVQRCCRIEEIINVKNSSSVGLTYTNKIPGIINGISYRKNSSPVFAQKDTAIVCHNAFFTFDFSATDVDGDVLNYSFTDGLLGGSGSTNGARPNPPVSPPPPYTNALLPYSPGFSGSSPMGPGVTINSATGIISGIAPNNTGTYVVAVAVNEYRGGALIGTTRKEIHIDVGNCSLTAAQLSPSYMTCDGFSLTFQNEIPTPSGSIYTWTFGDPASGLNNISSSATPTHTYSDTGIYKVKLKIITSAGCEDSATTFAKVYPGFFPGFISAGQCKNIPIQFSDVTKTNYGIVNSWSWNFGDPLTLSDTSHLQNPKYTYSTSADYDVSLNVSNSKGCSSTINQTISIKDKPEFSVTNDTLICFIDTLQLNAIGAGSFFWTPNYNINNQNTPSPLVSPDVPTKYYVKLTDPFGCIGTDSVFVDVKQLVTVDASKDTGICKGDAVQLNLNTDAISFTWLPATSLDNNMIKNPIATPPVTTKYYVTGNIGKCRSTDSVTIKVAPYPLALAKVDTAICFGDAIQLNASGGSFYLWSPSFFLNNPNIPNPVAKPDRSIRYIVSVSDTLGCPKTVFDTVSVQVQKIIAEAGPRDTSIVVDQPLQLNATGGQFYLWTPSTGLNNDAISNPVAQFSDVVKIDYVVRTSSAIGCFSTDTISVTVYKVSPGLYVPNAFTPNNDGLNDVFKPIALGIKQINYFKIFNRWGQLMFSTTQQNRGWDGKFKGKEQDTAVYVWIVEGVDYQNKKITQKGIVTLIR